MLTVTPTPCPHQPQADSPLLPVSVALPVLDISRTRSHTVALGVWLLSLSIACSRSVHVVVSVSPAVSRLSYISLCRRAAACCSVRQLMDAGLVCALWRLEAILPCAFTYQPLWVHVCVSLRRVPVLESWVLCQLCPEELPRWFPEQPHCFVISVFAVRAGGWLPLRPWVAQSVGRLTRSSQLAGNKGAPLVRTQTLQGRGVHPASWRAGSSTRLRLEHQHFARPPRFPPQRTLQAAAAPALQHSGPPGRVPAANRPGLWPWLTASSISLGTVAEPKGPPSAPTPSPSYPFSSTPESPAFCPCSEVSPASPASLPCSHLLSVPCHLQTRKTAPCFHVTSACGGQLGREALCGLPLLGRSLVPRAERPQQGTRSGLRVQP